jgi:hypothetical protein
LTHTALDLPLLVALLAGCAANSAGDGSDDVV